MTWYPDLPGAGVCFQAKDMDELLKELSEDPRRDGSEAVRADTSQFTYRHDPSPAPTRQLQCKYHSLDTVCHVWVTNAFKVR